MLVTWRAMNSAYFFHLLMMFPNSKATKHTRNKTTRLPDRLCAQSDSVLESARREE